MASSLERHNRALAAAEIATQEYLDAAGHDPVTGLGEHAVAEYLRVMRFSAEHMVSDAMRNPPVSVQSDGQ